MADVSIRKANPVYTMGTLGSICDKDKTFLRYLTTREIGVHIMFMIIRT